MWLAFVGTLYNLDHVERIELSDTGPYGLELVYPTTGGDRESYTIFLDCETADDAEITLRLIRSALAAGTRLCEIP